MSNHPVIAPLTMEVWNTIYEISHCKWKPISYESSYIFWSSFHIHPLFEYLKIILFLWVPATKVPVSITPMIQSIKGLLEGGGFRHSSPLQRETTTTPTKSREELSISCASSIWIYCSLTVSLFIYLILMGKSFTSNLLLSLPFMHTDIHTGFAFPSL